MGRRLVKDEEDDVINHIPSDHLITKPANRRSYLVMVLEGTQVIMSCLGGRGTLRAWLKVFWAVAKLRCLSKEHYKVIVRAIVTLTLLG